MGERVNMNSTDDINVKKKTTPILIILLLILLLCVVGVIVYLAVFSTEAVAKRQIRDKMELAERYLDELDYDRAIASYKEVLKIDPANADVLDEIKAAYLAWAKDQDDPEEADGILAEAEEYFVELAEYARSNDVSEEAERIVKRIRREREDKYSTAEREVVEDEETDEADIPDEGRREAEIIEKDDLPDPGALEGLLEAFTLFQDVEYDHEKAMYAGSGPEVLPGVVFNYGRISACYPMKVTEIWDDSEKDPKGIFQMFAYVSKADLQWVYRNVYNCSEEDTQRLLNMGDSNRYEYDGVIYFGIGGVGGPQTLKIDELSYDGVDYVVSYHIGYGFSDWEDYGLEEDYYKAVVRHKIYGTTGYWSIYSNTSAQAGDADGAGQPSDAYKEAYAAFLKENNKKCSNSLIYTEIYLDDDDIPELVVADPQNALAWSDGYIFTYRNNEVFFLGSIGYTGYGCFGYYEYGGLAFGDFAHTGTYGKSYMHVGTDGVSYHSYLAENYDIQRDMSFNYEETTYELGAWNLDADEAGFNAYRPYKDADLSVTISRADFEASDEKEFEAVRGKQRKLLTIDDYHPASEYK